MHWDRPTPRNRRSYYNYINDDGILAGNDRDFIKYSEDLVALGGELEDSKLNGILEDTLDTISRRASQVSPLAQSALATYLLLTLQSSISFRLMSRSTERTILRCTTTNQRLISFYVS